MQRRPARHKVFDNRDFEVRSPENWLSLAQDSEGNTVGLPARALFLQQDLTGAWRECKVQPPCDPMLLYERASFFEVCLEGRQLDRSRGTTDGMRYPAEGCYSCVRSPAVRTLHVRMQAHRSQQFKVLACVSFPCAVAPAGKSLLGRHHGTDTPYCDPTMSCFVAPDAHCLAVCTTTITWDIVQGQRKPFQRRDRLI